MSEMLIEDWLRGCVHHDGRHGEVTLPCDKVLEIADYIESTRERIEPKQGEWMYQMTEVHHPTQDRWIIEKAKLYCSECGEEAPRMTKFCPACGCRMANIPDIFDTDNAKYTYNLGT